MHSFLIIGFIYLLFRPYKESQTLKCNSKSKIICHNRKGVITVGTVIVGAVVVAIVALVIRSMVKKTKRQENHCSVA